MAKVEVETPKDMLAYVGKEVGVSDWVTVTQERINQFADATGDHQWIHVDVEKAKKELPGGKTIAHGYLTLSLIPMLSHDILRIRKVVRGLNYGCNKVRFTNMVPAGARVRGRQKLIAADPMEGNGLRLTNQMTIEIEGQDKPACVAETMSIVYG
jgi:acyl dehydratase